MIGSVVPGVHATKACSLWVSTFELVQTTFGNLVLFPMPLCYYYCTT